MKDFFVPDSSIGSNAILMIFILRDFILALEGFEVYGSE